MIAEIFISSNVQLLLEMIQVLLNHIILSLLLILFKRFMFNVVITYQQSDVLKNVDWHPLSMRITNSGRGPSSAFLTNEDTGTWA